MSSIPKRTTRIATLLVFTALMATGCAPRYLSSAPRQTIPSLPEQRLTSHVVLVSIDGLRSDAIGTFAAPTLRKLMRDGSYTLHASTITPSKTLPSHVSMLTGEPPERHGVLWNNVLGADSKRIDQTTVFGVARTRGYATAAFFSKPKFQALQRVDTLDYSQAPGGWWGGWRSARTVTDVERYLATSRPNLLFVHLTDPDRAGHASGWMSPAYGRAVSETDEAVRRLLTAADTAFGKGSYTVIVTADHGGHERNHGSDDPRDITIPWIVSGQAVKVSQLPDGVIRTMDTASTILWLLGVEEPTEWLGSPITGAFDPGTSASGLQGHAPEPTASPQGQTTSR